MPCIRIIVAFILLLTHSSVLSLFLFSPFFSLFLVAFFHCRVIFIAVDPFYSLRRHPFNIYYHLLVVFFFLSPLSLLALLYIHLFTFPKFVIPLLPIILNGELYICIIFPEPRSFPLSFKKGRFKSYTTADLNVLSTLATTFNQPLYVMTNPDQSNNLATTHDPTTQQKPFARVSVSYTKSNNATMNSCLLLSIQSFADGTPL